MPNEKGNDNVIESIIPQAPSQKETETESVETEEVEEVVTPAPDPIEPEEKETQEEEEIPDEREERIKKLEEERDNYKKALLHVKSKNVSLVKDDEPDKINEKWDETSQEFQKETLTKTENMVNRRLERMNEKSAIRRFWKKHPETTIDGTWNNIVSGYKADSGRDTVWDILDDLESSYSQVKNKFGEPSAIEKAKADGERAGIVKARSAEMASVSGTGNHSVPKSEFKKGLSDSAKEIASRMRTPLDKLEKEDDSTTAVIQI